MPAMSGLYFGIDLGTSNCAVASVADEGVPKILPVPQVVSANGIGEKHLLPSAVYLPAEGEFPDGLPCLPGEKPQREFFLGTHARERGALQPGRLIVSAKSWLCHSHADRRAPLLPYKSTDVKRLWSPLEATRELLGHFLKHIQGISPEKRAGLVITVPASFDETARSLTLEAAQEAGLGEPVLLEEPLAAFYAWLEEQGPAWRRMVKPGDLLLVVDVGGGTTDFSLIAVTEENGDLALERVAVGEHLLLGGDNLDLTLAHLAAERSEASGRSLDEWQFRSLCQTVREAKERLLSDNAPDELPLAVASRGRSLLAGSLTLKLTREEVTSAALNGFWPLTKITDMPASRRATGLREAGLPYASDPAISRHLARFLHRARENAASTPRLAALPGINSRIQQADYLLPDAVLFNGGFFHPSCLRRRVLELLSSWNQGTPPRELPGARPDHAVALGAAAYARLRAKGSGIRIRAGLARSYYVGLESAELAVPGRPPKIKALCIASQGMEEGAQTVIPDQIFYLTTGDAAEFRFFHSASRGGDLPGSLLPDASAAGLEETTCLHAEIPPPRDHPPGEEIPVRLQTAITETGNLELRLATTDGKHSWKLEFGVRLKESAH